VQLLAFSGSRGQLNLVRVLEEKGVIIASEAGEAALQSLSSTVQWDMCSEAARYLINNGVNTRSAAGNAVLVTAAVCGDLETVKLLAESGLDVASESGSLALSRAGELGGPGSTKPVTDYLTEMGAVPLKPVVLVMDDLDF